MNKETLQLLREAIDNLECSIEDIKQDRSLEEKQKTKYLEILDRALADINFIKSHYDVSLYLQENPEKADFIING